MVSKQPDSVAASSLFSLIAALLLLVGGVIAVLTYMGVEAFSTIWFAWIIVFSLAGYWLYTTYEARAQTTEATRQPSALDRIRT